MALTKLALKAGVNRENTRYASETGWYVCDKIRFRQGTPESIGGWVRLSVSTFKGVCRALWNWITLGGANLMAVGTNHDQYTHFAGDEPSYLHTALSLLHDRDIDLTNIHQIQSLDLASPHITKASPLGKQFTTV